MQNTSGITNYSTLIAGSYTVETKVNINGVDYGEDVLISVETTGSLFKDNLPAIGGCVSGEIDIQMLKPSASIPRMATIKPYIRLSNIAGTTKSGWLQKGSYFIDTRSVTHNDDGIDILKIHGYDAMLKAEATYPDDNETYPKSDSYVVNLIATTMGIQVDSRTSSIMNNSYQIVHPVFQTMRQVLKNIACMYAGNFCISPEGKLLLVQLGSVGDGTGTPNHLIGKNAVQLDVAPAFDGFSKVIIKTGEYDSSGNEIIYESGNTTGRTLECENDWGSQTIAGDILSVISGWSYQPYEATSVVINPALELGDSISINGVYSGIYTNTIHFNRLFTADTKAPYDEEIDHEYAFEDPREKKYIRRTEEMKAEMSILAGSITAKVDKAKTGETFGWTVTDNQWNVFNEDGAILTVNQGGAYVKGEIQADSGLIGGFNIGSDAIYHTINAYGSTASNTGVYLGTDGIQLGKKFLVDPYGNVSASALTVTGGSLSIGDDGNGNPMFQVTSAGYVTAKSLAIEGGTISIGNNFRVDAQGNLSAASGTFAGNVYAGNIKYEATTAGAGTVSGQALTLGSVTAGLSGSSPTGQLSLGASLSLGYADLFNAATGNGTSTYPNYFTAGRLIAMTSVRTPNYYVPAELAGDPDTNLSNHYHSINVDGSRVIIGGPYNSSTPPSFSIADTEFYQNAVSAVTVKSYGFEQDENQETDYTKLYVVLGLNGETTNTVGNLDISGSFNAGQNTGARTATISAVTIGSAGTPSYSSEDQVYYANVSVTGTARGTLADGSYYTNNDYSRTIAVDVTTVYNAGITAGQGEGATGVTCTAIALNTNWQTSSTGYVYESANNRYAANIRATLSNNRVFTNTVYIPASAAFSAGFTAGAETAYVSAITTGSAGTPSYSSEDQVYYANVDVTATARGTRANATYYTSTRTITKAVDVTEVYNAGKSSGAAGVTCSTIGLDTSWSTSSTGYYYQATNNRYAVRAKATLSNGETYSATLYVPDTDAFSAGSAAGAAGVTCSTIGLDTSWSTSSTGYYYQATNNRYAVRAKATLSNGVTYSATVYVPDTDAFSAGAAAGASGVTLSSIALNTDWSTSSTGYVYQTANNRFAVNIKATASNGNYSTQTIYVPAADAYNAGSAASAISSGSVIATDSTNYGTYDNAYNVSDANAYLTTSYRYGRIQLKNAAGTVLKTIRVRMARDADTSSSVTVSSVSALTTDSSNYSTYDFAVSRTAGTMYTSGSYMYGRATITLSNNVSKVLRFRVPSSISLSNITVTREHDPQNEETIRDCMPDWVIENNHVYIKTKLQAYSGSTPIGSAFDGTLCVSDVASFFATENYLVLATQSSTDNNNYDLDVDTTGYTNAFYKVGSYQYVRVQLKNQEGDNLDIVRVKMAATDMAITEVLALTSNSSTYQTYDRQATFAASSIYTPSGSTTQYARVQVNLNSGTHQVIRVALPASLSVTDIQSNCTSQDYSDYWQNSLGQWMLKVRAVSGNTTLMEKSLNVNHAVQWGKANAVSWVQIKSSDYSLANKQVTLYCYDSANNLIYQNNVRITYDDT